MSELPYEDPLAWLLPSVGQQSLKSFAAWSTFSKLPVHWHEVVLSTAAYQLLYLISGILAPWIVGPYSDLSKRTKVNFNIHVVSMVNCIVLLWLSYPLFWDPILAADTLHGYTPYAGFVCALAAGYFIWDTAICFRNLNMFGPEFLIHGAMAAFVFAQSFRPYILRYAPTFLMFEASTPFVNIHWFSSHLPRGYISETVKTINGLVLIFVFFFARIIWGWYQAYVFARDIFSVEVHIVPIWVPITVFASNMVLNVLNLYWFYKMIRAAISSLTGKSERKKQ